jgi:hypothetical protein
LSNYFRETENSLDSTTKPLGMSFSPLLPPPPHAEVSLAQFAGAQSGFHATAKEEHLLLLDELHTASTDLKLYTDSTYYLKIVQLFAIFVSIALLCIIVNDKYSQIEVTAMSISTPSNPQYVLSRVLHLITVENQQEIDEFVHFIPFFSSDVAFLCWNDLCHDSSQTKDKRNVYVSKWQHNNGVIITFQQEYEGGIRLYHAIQPQVFIINELTLNLSQKTTLTESRNQLASFVSQQEAKQGWKWSYINIRDGDSHLHCDRLLSADPDHHPWLNTYKTWLHNYDDHGISLAQETKCGLAFDAFVLTTAPGIGLPSFYDEHPEWTGGMISFHFDGVVAAFHHELFQLFHPLCERFDHVTWWVSQAYLILQSMCFLGHTLTNPYFGASNRDHRSYPHNPPFSPLTHEAMKAMKIFPERFLPSLKFMVRDDTYVFHLMPIPSFLSYPGFDISLVSDDCFTHIVDTKTCIQVPKNRTRFEGGDDIYP